MMNGNGFDQAGLDMANANANQIYQTGRNLKQPTVIDEFVADCKRLRDQLQARFERARVKAKEAQEEINDSVRALRIIEAMLTSASNEAHR